MNATGLPGGGPFFMGMERPMEYLTKKLAEIHPYENNPRIITDAVEDVMESIRQCSYIAPIVIDEEGVILARPHEI